MKKTNAILLFIFLIGLSACRIYDRVVTHALELDDINRHDNPMYSWSFGDLRGDEVDMYISTMPQYDKLHAIMVTSRQGKAISQINLGVRVRSLSVLRDPRDGSKWLFYSFNDQRSVTITAIQYGWQVPLKREERMFESIPRTDPFIDDPRREWYAALDVVMLEDIDADGKLDVVCRAVDGFTVNPRGLVVYDFETGKVKWRYDTPCIFLNVLFGDFDRDGSKEFILSTQALRNTDQVNNGLDDQNGWLVVLDNKGQAKYTEQIFEGYGETSIVAADTDLDGKEEIYVIKTTWGAQNIRNSVMRMRWEDKRLKREKTWDQSTAFERNSVQSFVNDMDGGGTWRIFLVDKSKGLVVLDKDLNIIPHRYKGFPSMVWAVEDIDGDGRKEALIQTADNHFVVMDMNLHVRAMFKSPFGPNDRVAAHVVKTGYGERKLIALSTPTQINYYRYVAEPLLVVAYRMLKARVGYLLIALAFVLAVLIVYIRSNWLFYHSTTANLSMGMIRLNNKDKVAFTSSYVKDLCRNKTDRHRARSLAYLIPELSYPVGDFAEGKERLRTLEVDIQTENGIKRHKVCIYRMQGFPVGFRIALVPVTDGCANDKLVWADTARRMSHHVRRHITNILLALPQDDEVTGHDEKTKENLRIIKGEIEKIRVFTHAFQRFTELKDYDLKLQDIKPSVEHSLSRTHIPEQVKLIRSWDLSSVQAYIEPIRFEEAMTNLITNALEAMPNGGNLHITVKEFPLHDSPKGPLSVLVEIEDSGRGIPAEYMDEIWQPFFTTNQSGTGIGLPESRKIIESMGGIIDIHSEVDVGTVVSVWLKGIDNGNNKNTGS